MQHRTYIGPHDEVSVFLPDGGELVVTHGDQIEVSAEDAALLDEQPTNWAKPTTNAAKKAEKEADA